MRKLYHYSTSTCNNVNLHSSSHQLEKKENRKLDFDTIIGGAFVIKETIALAKKIAPTDITVLLLGEKKIHKELFARAIHSNSNRAAKLFLSLNCADFSEELLEHEIFGYRSNVFTGIRKDKTGLIEEANGGTLFLNGLDQMSIDLRLKLMRVLESKELVKVGGTRSIAVDIRIIAAIDTNLYQGFSINNISKSLFYPRQCILLSQIK
jgi:two-component system NtrC family response regulator